MKAKSLFSIYVILGIMAAVTTQAVPIVYNTYGLGNNEIYNLISIVFLATAFQPLIGIIIDKFFTQERGISLLLSLVALFSVALVFITTYPALLFMILVLSIFRLPLFAIMDGFSAGVAHKYNLNMGLIRAGSTVGYGIGMASLLIFLHLFALGSNYTFLFIALLALIGVIIVEFNHRKNKNVNNIIKQNPNETDGVQETRWEIVGLLLLIQVMFFGFSILKVNYTTPYLVEYGYSSQIIATTTLLGVIPIFILIPLFSKIFRKYRHTTIIFAGIVINIIQTLMFLIFPTNVLIIYAGTFLNGFIFPLYSPIFGLLLRKVLSSKYISTGFTTIFTFQNLFVFFFNQFIIINLLNASGTVTTAFQTCLSFFLLSLIPLTILRIKKY